MSRRTLIRFPPETGEITLVFLDGFYVVEDRTTESVVSLWSVDFLEAVGTFKERIEWINSKKQS